jgi:F0F1-type ATP synthase assembly protein I
VGSTHAVTPPVAYEGEIARDLVRRILLVTPIVLLVAGVFWGVDGVVSALIGLVLVALNFLASARLITWAAQRSPGMVMGVVLGGYLARLGLLFGIALALEQVSWIDVPALLLTVAVVHLSLLAWETRHVSLTLGAPGLKPRKNSGQESYGQEKMER